MKFLSNYLLFIYLSALVMFAIYDTFLVKREPESAIVKLQKVEAWTKPHNKVISTNAKKVEFSNLIIPAIDRVHSELEAQYNEIAQNLTNPKYVEKILILKKIYKAESDEELLMALKPHPKA